MEDARGAAVVGGAGRGAKASQQNACVWTGQGWSSRKSETLRLAIPTGMQVTPPQLDAARTPSRRQKSATRKRVGAPSGLMTAERESALVGSGKERGLASEQADQYEDSDDEGVAEDVEGDNHLRDEAE